MESELKLIIFLLLISQLSCQSNSGKFTRTATCLRCALDSVIDDSTRFLNCREIDTLTMETISKGVFLNDLKTGNYYRHGWHSFFNNKKLIRQTEYIILHDSCYVEIPNQNIEFNEQGDTIKEKSTYIEIKPNNLDTFKLEQTIPLHIKVYFENNTAKIIGDYKLLIVNLNKNQKVDTVFSKKPSLKFDFAPDKSGLTNLEGEILFFIETKSKDSVDVIEISFNREYYIKK